MKRKFRSDANHEGHWSQFLLVFRCITPVPPDFLCRGIEVIQGTQRTRKGIHVGQVLAWLKARLLSARQILAQRGL
jgi:hypothetical protein